MDSDMASKMSALKEHLAGTEVKLYTPDASGFGEIESCFVASPVEVLGVARPQSADDVSTLVRYCTSNKIDFSVRSGGHDCAGRTKAQQALLIDMRDINYVSLSADKTTSRVGGGTLFGKIAKTLGEEGLATSCGMLSSVGYVGWSTLGGYGPFSSCYGLGVDQILGAKLVNAEGQIVDADEDMLTGIRGGGGTLGIIVELTIKVYPLGKFLVSKIMYESSNLMAAMSSYNEYYEGMVARHELPAFLQLQPMILQLPDIGMTFGVIATWAGPDEEEGRAWAKKIAGAAPCIMQSTQSIPLSEFMENNDKLLAWPSYGRTYTVSVKRLTPRTLEIIAKNSSHAPGGGLAFSIHTLRHSQPSGNSVFGPRSAHHVFEIIALVGDESLQGQRETWASNVRDEFIREDPENMLEESYISLGSDADTNLRKVYGSHYSKLLGLKKKYDGGNVFKYAVPRLIPLDANSGT